MYLDEKDITRGLIFMNVLNLMQIQMSKLKYGFIRGLLGLGGGMHSTSSLLNNINQSNILLYPFKHTHTRSPNTTNTSPHFSP